MTDTFTRLKSALSDRYTIESELGQGGMATVYLAHDVKHDRKVAVKVLRSNLSSELGADRFVRGGQGESRQIVDSPASGVANWHRNSTSMSILSKTVRLVNCVRRCWRPDSNRQGLSPNNLWSCRVYQFRHASTNPAANIDNPRARRVTTQEFRVARFIDSNLHAECTIISTRPWSVLCGVVFAVWRRIEAPRLFVHPSSTVLDRLRPSSTVLQ